MDKWQICFGTCATTCNIQRKHLLLDKDGEGETGKRKQKGKEKDT